METIHQSSLTLPAEHFDGSTQNCARTHRSRTLQAVTISQLLSQLQGPFVPRGGDLSLETVNGIHTVHKTTPYQEPWRAANAQIACLRIVPLQKRRDLRAMRFTIALEPLHINAGAAQ